MEEVFVSNKDVLGEGRYTGHVHKDFHVPHGTQGCMEYEHHSNNAEVVKYDGAWNFGKWHGYGVLVLQNGDSYIGSFCSGERHGSGMYLWADGRVYEGDFHQNTRQGTGQFSWPDGATYRGDFWQSQRQGQGLYVFPDGNTYDGSWKQGEYDGYGVFTWKGERVYRGEWRHSKHHGIGVEMDTRTGMVIHDGMWFEHAPFLRDNAQAHLPQRLQRQVPPSQGGSSTQSHYSPYPQAAAAAAAPRAISAGCSVHPRGDQPQHSMHQQQHQQQQALRCPDTAAARTSQGELPLSSPNVSDFSVLIERRQEALERYEAAAAAVSASASASSCSKLPHQKENRPVTHQQRLSSAAQRQQRVFEKVQQFNRSVQRLGPRPTKQRLGGPRPTNTNDYTYRSSTVPRQTTTTTTNANAIMQQRPMIMAPRRCIPVPELFDTTSSSQGTVCSLETQFS